MKVLYLDIFSGISGDMFLGAMLDLGVDACALGQALGQLHLPGYHLHVAKKQNGSIAGVKFDVHLEFEHSHQDHPDHDAHGHEHGHGHHHHDSDAHGHDHEHHEHGHPHESEHGHGHGHHEHDHEHGRNFRDIKQLIVESSLSDWVKTKAIAVFQRVAEAEGRVHGKKPEAVHFHEVGAVDSIVDIVGACIALEMLGKPRVLAANVVEGTGWVECAHGRFPVPTAATLEILGARGIAVTQCEEPHELVTPTGAALLAEFVEQFGPMQGLVAEQIGYGLGTRVNKTRPNVLRAVLGQARMESAATHDWETDTVAVLETNLDNLNPEILGYVMEKAMGEGALDLFYTPVQMKKHRPGLLVTLVCGADEADHFSEFLLRETSALGVRRTLCERRKLKREFTSVKTEHGEVTVKLGKLDGRVLQVAPEFESCRQVAETARVPLKLVYEQALKHAVTFTEQ
ncbi:MAG: nickel pincer cofactor biosynthesis protein LarC [Verrucomicrobiota bacterium]